MVALLSRSSFELSDVDRAPRARRGQLGCTNVQHAGHGGRTDGLEARQWSPTPRTFVHGR
jgi:hypothetical protein